MANLKQHALFRKRNTHTASKAGTPDAHGKYWAYDEVFELALARDTVHVLIYLCRHANPEGLSWPSVRRIAYYCRMSERAVYRALASLKRHHIIHIDNHSAEHTSSDYTVLPIDGWTAPRLPKLRTKTPPPDRLAGVPCQTGRSPLTDWQSKEDQSKEDQSKESLAASAQNARESLQTEREPEAPEPPPVNPAETATDSRGKKEDGLENGKRTIETNAEADRFITEALALKREYVTTPAERRKYHRQLQEGLTKYDMTIAEALMAKAEFARVAQVNGDVLLDYTRDPVREFGFYPSVVFKKYAEKRLVASKPRPEPIVTERPPEPPADPEPGPRRSLAEMFDELRKARGEAAPTAPGDEAMRAYTQQVIVIFKTQGQAAAKAWEEANPPPPRRETVQRAFAA